MSGMNGVGFLDVEAPIGNILVQMAIFLQRFAVRERPL